MTKNKYSEYSKSELIARINDLEKEQNDLNKNSTILINERWCNSTSDNCELELTKALLNASKKIPVTTNFKDAAKYIFTELKNLIGNDAGYIALLNSETKMNDVVYLEPGSQVCTVNPDLPMPIRGFRAIAYKTKKVQYHNDFKNTKWFKMMPEGHTILENVMFAPMIIDNQVAGLIGLSNKPGGFNDNDAEMALEFGVLAVIALKYTRNLEENRKIENELKLSESKYKILYEKTPVMLHSIDSEGNLLSVSDFWLSTLGYSKDEVIGKKSLEFLTPESQAKFFKLFPRFKEKGEIYDVEYQMVKSNGEVLDVLLSAISEKNSDGSLKRTLAVITDVTGKRKAERELKKMYNIYRTLISNLPGINVFLFDDDKRILVAEGGEFKDGLNIKKDYENKHISDLNYSKKIKEKLLDLYKKSLDNISASDFFYYQKLWYNALAIPILSSRSKVIGCMLVIQNITDLKNANIELELSRKRLSNLTHYLQQEIEKEKAAVAREIHDELGQNLTYVKLNLSLFLQKMKSLGDDVQLAQLKNTYDTVDQAIKKVKKVTSYLRPALIDELGIVPAIEWLLDDFKKKTQIEYHFNYNHEVMDIDKDISINLFRIVQEALTNCLKYAKASKVDVDLQKYKTKIKLGIHNNGKGIKKSEIRKVSSYGITGMRERAELFNGHFSIYGSDKGTFINVDIPIK